MLRRVEECNATPLREEEGIGRVNDVFIINNVEWAVLRRRDEQDEMNNGIIGNTRCCGMKVNFVRTLDGQARTYTASTPQN